MGEYEKYMARQWSGEQIIAASTVPLGMIWARPPLTDRSNGVPHVDPAFVLCIHQVFLGHPSVFSGTKSFGLLTNSPEILES